MGPNRFVVKAFGIIVIVVLIMSALAPIFYAFAPRYIPTPVDQSVALDPSVESVTAE